MPIEYDTTLDEVAEVHVRAYLRTPTAKRQRWQWNLATALMAGGLVYVVLLFPTNFPLSARLIAAAVGMIFGAGIYLLRYRSRIKRALARYLREQMKSEFPLHFMIELRDEGIWERTGGTEVTFDWRNLDEVADLEEGVELHFRDGGFAMVLNRGFPTPESRREFVETATSKMQAAHTRVT